MPESQQIFPLSVAFVPSRDVIAYGDPRAALSRMLGIETPRGRAAILLHPKPTAPQRRLRGVVPSGVSATPTSSIRTMLAFRGRRCAMLKLSLGAIIAKTRRALTEEELARGTYVSTLLDAVVAEHGEKLHFEHCPERAGLVHRAHRHGWLLRELPPAFFRRRTTVMPAFSLSSRFVEWIGRTSPEQFVLARLIKPYIGVLAHLLLFQGIQLEAHAQNVLFEVDPDRGPTGRIILRDFSDARVDFGLRRARGLEAPALPPGRNYFPRRSAQETLYNFGLRGFVGSLNIAAKKYFPRYDAELVERTYLAIWQYSAINYLGVQPARAGKSIVIDAAIREFVRKAQGSRR